jgi:antitoxin (DNA-binding transcriptional repressor) of toxin-antitoxin stability system
MKTITAKDFQLHHSSIVKDVANGHEYEVTFHRKPLIKLVPVSKAPSKNLEPGSRGAFIKALQYTASSEGDLYDLPYKQLRDRMLKQRYGS